MISNNTDINIKAGDIILFHKDVKGDAQQGCSKIPKVGICMSTVTAPIPMHIYGKYAKYQLPQSCGRPGAGTPSFFTKIHRKKTFIVFSDLLLSDVRRNGFLSSDINLSDQIGSFDTHIAILCDIFDI